MEKKLLNASYALNIVLSSVCLFFGLCAVMQSKKQEVIASSNYPVHKIAILTPVTHPSLEKIEAGFKKTLKQYGLQHYVCDVFNANGDKKLLRAQAEEIVSNNYDLIFTIASHPSQMVKELCVKKNKKTPLIFGAVDDPVALGLVKGLSVPGETMTGVFEKADFENQIAFLRLLKPTITNIMLIYNPTQGSGLERQKNELESVCYNYGISIKAVEVYQSNEVYAKASGLIQGTDCVFVLKDNTVVPALDSIVKLCSMHHVMLMASDLDSAERGACLSYGVDEEEFGIQSALLGLKVLDDYQSPGNIPCITPGNRKLLINTRTMQQQGLIVDKQLLKFYESVTVIS